MDAQTETSQTSTTQAHDASTPNAQPANTQARATQTPTTQTPTTHAPATQGIPKLIHYCWFGGAQLGELEQKCIASWKKFMPDYEIVQWDESNFDISQIDYTKQAYEAKKWAFVSDYARFKILYENGGIYLDTDVEIIRPLNNLLDAGAYFGCEQNAASPNTAEKHAWDECFTPRVNPGLGMACAPKNDFCKKMLDSYKCEQFINEDGSFNTYNVVSRTTDALIEEGLENVSGIQTVAGFNIYPQEYLNPKDYDTGEINITPNTYSIHHFAMSWLCKSELLEHKYFEKYAKAGKTGTLWHYLARYRAILVCGDFKRLFHNIKKIIKK